MRDGEEDFQELSVRNLIGVVGDLHRFRVTRRARADDLVMRRRLAAAGEARDDVADALEAFEDGFDSPEAAAGQHGGLRSGCRRLRIDRGIRKAGNGRGGDGEREQGSGSRERASHVRVLVSRNPEPAAGIPRWIDYRRVEDGVEWGFRWRFPIAGVYRTSRLSGRGSAW